ncbi:hypothetical protein BRARA_A02416 [Brassica rapa]|uniref:Malectin-like domain-containing protein n=1 Tax=Brassica campestris TaxID=3711 RepID=A0A398AQ60_BRACM|nr:hypothetical protein BRARA_A02416 [Brassica rapa]
MGYAIPTIGIGAVDKKSARQRKYPSSRNGTHRVTIGRWFISLDCGLFPDEQYTEFATGLQYSSDSNFIQTGKISRIQRSLEENHLKPQRTVRYFPEGMRNCYNITVKQGTNYLIRVRAIYGNYDGLNHYPMFDLYIGPNYWVTIDTQKNNIFDTKRTLFLRYEKKRIYENAITFRCHVGKKPAPRRNSRPYFH